MEIAVGSIEAGADHLLVREPAARQSPPTRPSCAPPSRARIFARRGERRPRRRAQGRLPRGPARAVGHAAVVARARGAPRPRQLVRARRHRFAREELARRGLMRVGPRSRDALARLRLASGPGVRDALARLRLAWPRGGEPRRATARLSGRTNSAPPPLARSPPRRGLTLRRALHLPEAFVDQWHPLAIDRGRPRRVGEPLSRSWTDVTRRRKQPSGGRRRFELRR